MRLTCKRKGGEEDEGGCWQAGLPRLPRDACKEGTRSLFGRALMQKEGVPKYMKTKKSQGPRGPKKKGQIQTTFHLLLGGGVSGVKSRL